MLAGDAERRPRGHEQLQPRDRAEQVGDEWRRVDDLLEVVEDEEGGAGSQPVHDHVAGGPAARFAEPEGARDLRGHEPGVAHRVEGDEEDAVREAVDRVAGHLDREPRLAGAARTGQRDEPVARQQPVDRDPFGVAPDERGELGRQRVRPRVDRAQRRELAAQPVGHQLVQVLRLLEVLEAVSSRGRGTRSRPVPRRARATAHVPETSTWPPWATAAIRAARLMSRPTSEPPWVRASPEWTPIRTRTWAPSGQGSAASARCAARAAAIAPRAERKTTKKESPSVPCSSPPCAANASRRSVRCRSRIAPYAARPDRLLQPGRALDVGEEEGQRRAGRLRGLDGRLGELRERGRFLHLRSGRATSGRALAPTVATFCAARQPVSWPCRELAWPDPPASTVPASGAAWPGPPLDREADLEAGLARAGAHLDPAPVAAHHVVGDVQPEPGAAARRLGRVEGLEDPLADLRGHPRPVVTDLDDHVAVAREGADLDPAVAAHRIDRVVEDVRPHLVELAAERLDRRQPGLVVAHDLDPALELGAQDDQRVLQAGRHVHLLDRCLVHVRVVLDRPDDLGDPAGAGADLVDEGMDLAPGRDPLDHRAEGGAGERRVHRQQVLPVPAPGGEARGKLRGVGDAAPGQVALQVVGPVTHLERVGGGARGRQAGDLGAEVTDDGGTVGIGHDAAQGVRGVRPSIEGLAQQPRAALHGGRRVVELVGQPGGERPQRGQLLAFAEQGLGAPQATGHGADDRHRGGRARAHQLQHDVAADRDDATRRDGPDGRVARRSLEDRHLADDLARTQAGERHVGRTRPLHHLQLAVRDHEQRVALVALGGHDVARRQVGRLAGPGDPVQVVVGKRGEQGNAPEQRAIGRRERHRAGAAYRPARCWWTNWTAIEPSPTADAIRLTERERTSPAQKMPGTLVSSMNGSRASGQPGTRSPLRARPGPVTTKPAWSRSTMPLSQSVRGAWPMNTNIAATGSVSRVFVSASSTSIDSSAWPPATAVTDARRRTAMFGVSRDLVDQVGGHARVQRPAADEQCHVLGEPGQVHGRLAGRVAAAHHRDPLAAVEGGLRGRRPVVDARPREAVRVRQVQRPVLHAGRDEQGLAAHLGPVGQGEDLVPVVDREACHRLRRQHLGAEARRLGQRAARQVGAAQPGRESQVVLDSRRRAGLAPGRLALDEQGREPLRGAVDGGGQTRRPASGDHQVVVRQRRVRPQPDPLGDLRVRRPDEVAAVGEDDERLVQRIHAGARGQGDRLGVGLDVEPAVRELVPGEVVLDGVPTNRPAVAHDPDPFERRAVAGPPVRQQVLEDREEPLLRRVPGLEEVVVQADGVDRRDGDLGVRVGREQDPFRVGVNVPDRLEELDARHARHPLVGQEQGDGGAAQLEPARRVEGGRAAVGSHDPVVRPESAPQVPLDGAEHLRIVVDRQDDRLVHDVPPPCSRACVGPEL